MNVVELLQAGKAVIVDEKNWTQGYFARDKQGQEAGVDDRDAVCFCSLGALMKVGYGAETSGVRLETEEILSKSARALSGWGGGYIHFNDYHTHSEVMQMWNKAIELAEADAKL